MATENNELEAKKQLIKALFADYEKADGKVEEAKKVLETALLERSNIVNQMSNKLGKTKLKYKGEEVTIVMRKGKKEGATETWFLRGAKKKEEDEEVIDIE